MLNDGQNVVYAVVTWVQDEDGESHSTVAVFTDKAKAEDVEKQLIEYKASRDTNREQLCFFDGVYIESLHFNEGPGWMIGAGILRKAE